jgi:hypothetical protein
MWCRENRPFQESGLIEFLESLLSPEGWIILASAVAVLAFLGIDGRTGFSFLSWVFRGFKPAAPTVQHFKLVDEEKAADEPDPPDRIRHGLPPLTRAVRGREQELADLRTGLAEKGEAAIVNPGAVLQGQGGVGKTTLARHYAEEYARRYTGIVWATAETEGALA